VFSNTISVTNEQSPIGALNGGTTRPECASTVTVPSLAGRAVKIQTAWDNSPIGSTKIWTAPTADVWPKVMLSSAEHPENASVPKVSCPLSTTFNVCATSPVQPWNNPSGILQGRVTAVNALKSALNELDSPAKVPRLNTTSFGSAIVPAAPTAASALPDPPPVPNPSIVRPLALKARAPK
jgi:hypothetical protein